MPAPYDCLEKISRLISGGDLLNPIRECAKNRVENFPRTAVRAGGDLNPMLLTRLRTKPSTAPNPIFGGFKSKSTNLAAVNSQ